MLVCSSFLPVLRGNKTLLGFRQLLRPPAHEIIDLKINLSQVSESGVVRCLPIVEHGRCIWNAAVPRVLHRELCNRQPIFPVGLERTHKKT